MVYTIFILLIAGVVAYAYYTREAREKTRSKTEQVNYNNTRVDYSNISDEEYKLLLLQKLDGLNSNLLYLQNIEEKNRKHLDNIQFNTSFIAIVVLIVIIIRIILVVAGVQTANNILSMF